MNALESGILLGAFAVVAVALAAFSKQKIVTWTEIGTFGAFTALGVALYMASGSAADASLIAIVFLCTWLIGRGLYLHWRYIALTGQDILHCLNPFDSPDPDHPEEVRTAHAARWRAYYWLTNAMMLFLFGEPLVTHVMS